LPLAVGYGLDPLLETHAWSASFMDKISSTAAGMVQGIKAAGFEGETWVGESAFAWHSGRVGVTDTFLSAPWWMSALGQLSPTHSGFCRQTIIGGNYELVNKTTRTPNPDWYVARLWKDAMGPASFAASSNDSDVRVYAHCAPAGGVTVAYINFSGNTTAALQVAGGAQGPLPGSRRLLRALSSRDNATVALNGRDLVYVPGSGALPPLEPAADAGNGPLLLPPHTLGFVTFPDATAYDC
jgi:heparanase 1